MNATQPQRTSIETRPATRQVTAFPRRTAQRPPCADDPNDWDLDVGTPDSWRAAVQTCFECPLRVTCDQLVQELTARGDGPRAMIWAGVAYDSTGRIVDNLERHRAAPLDHRRPLRIIRTGTRPAAAAPAPSTPRRIVLGHRLRPTGTGPC
ncbi:hypothetical protein [Nocardia vaccinii]|uniref:hypothetical protein n=1 Tax=Nocardia vaccinii TaxID=1822 RepID=UPI0008314518|nr:hypothetical protein [Nocardia vaccinii]